MTRKTLSRTTRKIVFDRDNRLCRYCGRDAAVIDHVMPVCRVGTNDTDNLVAACVACNTKANGLYFKTFEHKKAFVLDPTKATPSVMEMRTKSRKHKNHPWHRPVNSRKRPPSGRFGRNES